MQTTLISGLGWVRIALLLLLGTNYFIVSMNHAVPTFHGYIPPFSCEADESNVQGCVTVGNASAEGVCPGGYTFQPTDGAATIAAEWQLVCGRRALLPLAASLYFAGVMAGAVVLGMLADRWGRRPVMLACLAAQAALGCAIFFSPCVSFFMGLRFVQGFFVQGVQCCTYTYVVEVFPPHMRTAIAVVLEIFWAVGLAMLAALDFLLPDWRWLQLTIAAPVLFAVFYSCTLTESPLWLAVRGRHAEAQSAWLRLCPRSATPQPQQQQGKQQQQQQQQPAGNGSSLQSVQPEPGQELDRQYQNGKENGTIPNGNGFCQDHEEVSILDLVKTDVIRKYSFVMMFTWFSVSLSYYGVMFYMPVLAGQRHLNFFLGAAIEAASYASAFWFLMRCGCRRPLAAYLAVSGVLCCAVGAINVLPDSAASWIGMSQTVLTLVGKAALVSGFCALYLYTSELFPTVLRAAAMGLCGFWARLGSLIAPQLLLLGEYTTAAVPLAAMGLLCLAAGVCVLALPETHGQPLPDTVRQAQELAWRGRPAEASTRL